MPAPFLHKPTGPTARSVTCAGMAGRHPAVEQAATSSGSRFRRLSHVDDRGLGGRAHRRDVGRVACEDHDFGR